jgi:hypothetical protein
MLRVQAMDSTLSNRPLTVGWGYFLSPLSPSAPRPSRPLSGGDYRSMDHTVLLSSLFLMIISLRAISMMGTACVRKTEQLIERYSRQRNIVPMERLHACKATVIGVDAIGHRVALQLTATGIRWLQIVDFDTVQPSKLASKSYWEDDLGQRSQDGGPDHSEWFHITRLLRGAVPSASHKFDRSNVGAAAIIRSTDAQPIRHPTCPLTDSPRPPSVCQLPRSPRSLRPSCRPGRCPAPAGPSRRRAAGGPRPISP